MKTLELLITQHAASGRFRAVKHLDEYGNPFWAVDGLLVVKPLYAPLTQHDAVILAGLCNLTDDPDWSTLQPYVDELLPHIELKPTGTQ